MMLPCPECKKQISSRATACPHCGCPTPDQTQAAPANQVQPESQDPWTQPISIPWRLVLPTIGAGLILFLSMYHIVWIRSVPTPIRRTSLSLSEPMSNLDEISGVPWIAATSKFPLTVKALQQAGVLESDEARQQRIQAEIRSKAEQEYRRILEEHGLR